MVIGAYPSAVHVRWRPPDRHELRPVAALPVDNEPEPFWDGVDAAERVASWTESLGAGAGGYGTFTLPKGLNGPSGSWVTEKILGPLGVTRGGAWITDCLDTYRLSTGVAARLCDTYEVARQEFGGPAASIAPHPTENDIVYEAVREHAPRLRAEIATCAPATVVTLGNAAARVLAMIAGEAPRKLSVDGYGAERSIRMDGHEARWLPLAHPAAPLRYQEAHEQWVRRKTLG